MKVEYRGAPVYGRMRAEAQIEIGVLGLAAWGETHEEAQRNLLHRAEMHLAEVRRAIETIRESAPPKMEPTR